jgi:signal transduction histidine kinase/ligand-binding sensor domain-containing protein
MTLTRRGEYCALVKLRPGLRLWAAAACFCVLWCLPGTAWGLDPHRHASQFGHTAWRTLDGFVSRSVAVTQTADGYIWIATHDGLVRFDGVKFSSWSPPPGESLPAPGLSALLGARDGSLWIGTVAGLSHLKDGHLFNYTTTARSPGISAMVEDRAGTIWVTRYRVNDGMGPLCRVAGERLICFGKKDGLVSTYGIGLAAQSDGTLWFACRMVCRFTAGAFTSYFDEQVADPAGGGGAIDIAAEPSGSVWVSFDGVGPRLGVQRYSDGKWAPFVVPGFDGSTVRSHTLFVDRHGVLWVGTESSGLYCVHDGHADHYERSDGLSGNQIGSIYEDREGNLWVATDRGIDMFRDTSVVTFSTIEGLVGSSVQSVLALRDGTVWVGNEEALNIIDRDGIRAIDAQHGLPGQDVAGLFEDSAGRIWLGVASTVMTYEAGRFSPIFGTDGRPLAGVGLGSAFAEDRGGHVWALTRATPSGQHHLLRIKDRRVVEEIPVDTIIDRAGFLATDHDGAVWIAGSFGEFARVQNGKADVVVRLDSPEGAITAYSLSVDSDGGAWFATNRGLYRWLHGRMSRLDGRNGLPCAVIYSAIRDDEGAFWLYARCGLLRIRASEWAAWLKASDRKVSVDVFDLHDGAQPSTGVLNQPVVSKSPDGRLWFASTAFVQMIDPRRTYVNTVPPPVRIEAIVADGKNYATVAPARLPPLRRELEIDYTALSFKFPEKVFFRYKLEGQDTDWHDAGLRRQALYNDLGPGNYRFRVVASNDDGVWNEAGAAADFAIAPAYYQTAWFRSLAMVTIAALLWTAHRLRLRIVERHQAEITALNDQLVKAQEQERMRIAGELHDGVMQQVSSLSLMLGIVKRRISTDPADAKARVGEVQQKLLQVGTEVRQLTHNLYPPVLKESGLPEALRAYCDEFSHLRGIPVACDAHDGVRDLSRGAALALYRIAQEALGNAAKHAAPHRIDVRLTLSGNDVHLTVSDDGAGPNPSQPGTSAGLGLISMRERARQLNGTFAFESEPGRGTTVSVTIPFRPAS